MTKTAAATPASKRRRKAPAQPAPAPEANTTKLERIITLLRRDEGAGIAELMAATGWQAHSIRGALSGTLKKRLGLAVTSEASEAGRVYRIVGEAVQ